MTINRQNIAAGSDTVFTIRGGCTSYFVAVPPIGTSNNGVIVHIDGLHDADEYIPISPGDQKTFRYLDRQLSRVAIQADPNTNGGVPAVGVTYGAVSKTVSPT
jgi:hypothetical protein